MAEHSAWVAGATGYTGQAVVRELIGRGITTVAHIRPDSPRRAEWERKFTTAGAIPDSTPWELQALARRLDDFRPRWIFSLIGTTRARMKEGGGRGAAGYFAIDYGLSAMLLQAAAILADAPARRGEPPPLFIYLSSMGVGPGPRGPYLAARRRMELDLARSPLPHIIARPALITGPDREERRPTELWSARIVDGALARVARLGAQGLSERYRSIDARHLARALVHLAETGRPGVYLAQDLQRAAREGRRVGAGA